MTGMMSWMDICSLGRTGWEEKEVRLPFVRRQLVCLAFCLGMGDEPTETLRVRIKEQTNMGDVVVAVCYMSSL